ncbi:unnamed protein product [Ambrosiozyma monospora]|uniref:Unnamed protein product n=1 Tax=Ambrosiozyma monospora TaxID=43982 RepID=A0A9W6YSC1_AMBMO|nr:unnamed protein product [Ambrosiozyma monospora]
MGIPFDVIFNKIDKVNDKQRVHHLEKVIKNSVLGTLKIQPRYYFVNSVDDPKSGLSQRTGINEIRLSILESSGLEVKSIKPKLRKKKENQIEERIKRKNVLDSIKKTKQKQKQKEDAKH